MAQLFLEWEMFEQMLYREPKHTFYAQLHFFFFFFFKNHNLCMIFGKINYKLPQQKASNVIG